MSMGILQKYSRSPFAKFTEIFQMQTEFSQRVEVKISEKIWAVEL